MQSLTQIIEAATDLQKTGLKFSVDFDLVWKPLGYRSRNVAARRFLATFIQNHDYLLRLLPDSSDRPQCIMMTFDCFVVFAALAQTVQGRQLRQYLADRESAIRDDLERAFSNS